MPTQSQGQQRQGEADLAPAAVRPRWMERLQARWPMDAVVAAAVVDTVAVEFEVGVVGGVAVDEVVGVGVVVAAAVVGERPQCTWESR